MILNWNSIYACGNGKWFKYFGKQLAISYKVKHTPTLWPSHSTPKENEKALCPHKDCTQMFIPAFIWNSQKLETSKCPSEG